ncbi:MAG: hypothetical protein IKE59_07310, partial [Erysipelotrichaceae bacterium]|nr:hypothetical protein [Erysipelotrichaceae bacterium]
TQDLPAFMPEVQKGQEQPVFLTFILYRYNLSFYYNQVQYVPVFIIEKEALPLFDFKWRRARDSNSW